MDERTREFENFIHSINAEAKGLGYIHGLDWAKKAGVLGASDVGSYEGAHYLRNAVSHGRAMDVRVTQETLDFVCTVLLTIQATTQVSNASKFRRSFIQGLFSKKKDDLPKMQDELDVDDRTGKFLNVIESINAEACGLGYKNGRDWAENAGILSKSDADSFISAHCLRIAVAHGRAQDVHVTQETLDFVQEILRAIQAAGQTADASKPRTSFFRNPFNKKKNNPPAEEPVKVAPNPEPKPESKPDPKPGTLEWYLQNAEKGDAAAQCELGRRYLSGEGVAEDTAEAMNWYSKAAEQGNADAQLLLGQWYENGTNVAADKAEALKWYRMAGEKGSAELQLKLATWYDYGIATFPNWDEAKNWYAKAADQGNVDAQYRLASYYAQFSNKAPALKYYRMAAQQGHAKSQLVLGEWYENGTGGPQDREEAVKWYLQAAENGMAEAQYPLGRLYDRMGQPNRVNAEKWYRLAAERGVPEAQCALAEYYQHGYITGVADREEARKWYEKAVKQGYAQAQRAMGDLVEWDAPEEAHKWYIKAAEQNDVEAMLSLAHWYAEGDRYNEKEIVKWLQKAAKLGSEEALDMLSDYRFDDEELEERYIEQAETGDPDAMYQLGYNYLYGCGGVSKDPEKAIEWLREAADREHEEAIYELAICYENGWGVDEDEELAARFYVMAAGFGHWDAQYQAGRCYEFGEGVDQDDQEAIYYYEKAAQKRHYEAKERLELLESDPAPENFYLEDWKATRRYAERGEAYFQYELGAWYEARKNRDGAFKWYLKAAEQGFAEAQYSLACLYRDMAELNKRTGKAKQYMQEADKWFRAAAEHREELRPDE